MGKYRGDTPERAEYRRQWRAAHPDKTTEYSRRFRERHPDRCRESRIRYKIRKLELLLQKQYGITLEDYTNLMLSQHGLCAICQSPAPEYRRLDVDHDHATGQVRGLLCSRCNVMLGFVGDDVSVLRHAIEYLSNGASDAS